MFIGLVTFCCALLPVVTFLEGKRLSKLVPGSHFIFVSNPRIACCIRSLGLLRVVTRCYLLLHLWRGKCCQRNFQVHILYSFPTHEYPVTYGHWACYVLLRDLRVITCCYIFRGENVCQCTFQVPILYSFPTHEYLVTYGHWACYVLLRVVTRCYLLLHL